MFKFSDESSKVFHAIFAKEKPDGSYGLKRNPLTSLLIKEPLILATIGVKNTNKAICDPDVIRFLMEAIYKHLGGPQCYIVFATMIEMSKTDLNLLEVEGFTKTLTVEFKEIHDKIRAGILDPIFMVDKKTHEDLTNFVLGASHSDILVFLSDTPGADCTKMTIFNEVAPAIELYRKLMYETDTCREPNNNFTPLSKPLRDRLNHYLTVMSLACVERNIKFPPFTPVSDPVSNKHNVSPLTPIPANSPEYHGGLATAIKTEVASLKAMLGDVYGNHDMKSLKEMYSSSPIGLLRLLRDEIKLDGIKAALECCKELGVVEDGDHIHPEGKRNALNERLLTNVVGCHDRYGVRIKHGTALTPWGDRYLDLLKLWDKYLDSLKEQDAKLSESKN